MYKVQLNNFEGPIDLLLYFIRRDELDVYDIPISKITKEFVRTIEEWKKMNLHVAGDFLVMASTLMRIKAKLLLPRPELDEEGVIIDPRTELIHQLVEYKRFKNAAELLNNLSAERESNFSRELKPVIKNEIFDDSENIVINASLFDLARVFKTAIDNMPVVSQFELSREPVKLEEQKDFIFKHFDGDGKLKFSIILNKLDTRMKIVVTFLAVLDLVREGLCSINQEEVFGELELQRVTTAYLIMKEKESDKIIESLLFASSDPLSQTLLNQVFDKPSPVLNKTVNRLNEFYHKHEKPYRIDKIAGGYQLVTRPEYEIWIRRLVGKSNKLILSAAALDTLAIIAYKQPIGRYDVEAIRGVDSSGVIKTLLSRNLIAIKGRGDGPGRPLLYSTTKLFLEKFGLNSLSDMPKLKEVSEIIESDPSLGEQITAFEDKNIKNKKISDDEVSDAVE